MPVKCYSNIEWEGRRYRRLCIGKAVIREATLSTDDLPAISRGKADIALLFSAGVASTFMTIISKRFLGVPCRVDGTHIGIYRLIIELDALMIARAETFALGGFTAVVSTSKSARPLCSRMNAILFFSFQRP